MAVANGPFLELDTPALVVDADIMARNIDRMATSAAARGIALRPHIKTHKSPYVAHRQLQAGSAGITCAKLSEAEVMVDAGITNILIAYPILGETKLRRLRALACDADLTVSVDSLGVAAGISRVGQDIGRQIPVYLEVDTGLRRLGLPAGDESITLGCRIAELPGIRLTGVMTHAGHVGAAKDVTELEALSRRQAEALVQTAEGLRQHGIPISVVSPGSTLAAGYELDTPGVTEIRPGTYVFNDLNTMARGIATEADCAASVIVTVVSRPAPDRAVVDGGSKTFSSDRCSVPGFEGSGWVKGHPGLRLVRLSEEHGVLSVAPSETSLQVGDRLQIIPAHICPVVNLFDEIVLTRGGSVERHIPVTARGKRT